MIGTAAVLCLVGSYSTVAVAAGPVLRHGSQIASGVSSAVGNAIMHANQEAERHAQRHYDARDEYMSRRRLSPSRGRRVEAKEDTEHDQHPVVEKDTGRTKSALLLRMAALRKREGSIGIEESAVEQFFPGWVRPTHDTQHWNEDAVLLDLVMAVSQLAYAVSVDSPPDQAARANGGGVSSRTKALPPPELLSDDAPT